jgi:DNA-binding transcriptional MerR regulator
MAQETSESKGSDLISKKDLLAQTGISYGQLYRWKRERLLPEEWFIKRSAFTGQETFFPRERVLERIAAIGELKDRYSLEEIARLLNAQLEATVPAGSLAELLGGSSAYLQALLAALPKGANEQLGFAQAVFIAALARALPGEEPAALAALAAANLELACGWVADTMEVAVLRLPPAGTLGLVMYRGGARPVFSADIEVAGTLALDAVARELRPAFQSMCSEGARAAQEGRAS